MISLPDFDFEKLNEADVREEIITPLLKEMGYRAGTENNIIREQSLRYPRVYIGKKSPTRDPIIRGSADYICDVQQKLRWVIEAKGPDVDFGLDEIEQAYSYANHPEVRAVYFCLTNGREFRVYQTNHGPDADAILIMTYDQLTRSFDILENLLGPTAILRDHPSQALDLGKPIGPGLRSVARIVGGHIIFNTNTLGVPHLNGITQSIEYGAVERDAENHLIAYFHTRSPFKAFQQFNERLGLADLETTSADTVLSADEKRPTIFNATQHVVLAQGERIWNVQTGTEIALPFNLNVTVDAKGSGALIGSKFIGIFTVVYKTNILPDFSVRGEFEISLN